MPLLLNKKILIRVIGSIFLAMLISNFVVLTSQSWSVYIRPFYPERYHVLKELFDQSQYVKSHNPVVIPDEYYYALAGWNYSHGVNPLLFNGEQPPLGKYFIALTIFVFNNETLSGPIFNLLCLIGLFILGKLILGSWIWALTMTTAFSFEKIFQVQMKYAPLLDNIQLFFILLSFYFFLLWLRGKITLIIAFIFLGLIISTKFWITGAVIFVIWFLSVLFFKKNHLFKFLKFLPISLVILIATYIPSFFYGESFIRILGVQKYIYSYHSGKFHFNPFAFFDLLLLNRWHVTWENTIKPSVDFQLTWPLLLILSLIAINKIFFQKKGDLQIKVVSFWFIIYSVFLFFGTLLTRYLIPVLPAMYLLSFYLIKNLSKK